MGILDAELEKFGKSEKFKKLVNQEIKNGKISGGSNLKKLNIEAVEKVTARLKEILEEEISYVETNDPRLRNPLVKEDAITISKPTPIEIGGDMYYEVIVSLDGPSVRKKSISPNGGGLKNVLLLYDTGYSHPIMGRLPYKIENEEKVVARRNIPSTGFISKAIDKFNLENTGFAVAARD